VLPPRSTSLTLLLVFAVLGTILGLFAHGNRRIPGDVWLLETIQRVDLPGIANLVRASNAIFDTGGALALGVIFMATALLLHRPEFVLQLVVVIVLRLAAQTLKPMFASPRPGIEHQPDPSVVSHTYGYPSGHAFTATVIVAMAVILVLTFNVSRGAHWATIAAGVLVALFAMFSRVWVGAHWPSDTVGGVLFGIATVALMQLVVGVIALRGTAQHKTASVRGPSSSINWHRSAQGDDRD
jgi:undecaprenyl-diphosphatase